MNHFRYDNEKIEYEDMTKTLTKMNYSPKIDFAQENRKNLQQRKTMNTEYRGDSKMEKSGIELMKDQIDSLDTKSLY